MAFRIDALEAAHGEADAKARLDAHEGPRLALPRLQEEPMIKNPWAPTEDERLEAILVREVAGLICSASKKRPNGTARRIVKMVIATYDNWHDHDPKNCGAPPRG